MKAPKNFEDGMQQLQTLLEKLQDENTPLADSIKLYAQAATLIEYCSTALSQAKLQIDEIDAEIEKTMPKGEDA